MKRDPIPCRLFLATAEEVFITQVCLKCHRCRPLAAFGLRRMGGGKIRSNPWCKECRSRPDNFKTRRLRKAVNAQSRKATP